MSNLLHRRVGGRYVVLLCRVNMSEFDIRVCDQVDCLRMLVVGSVFFDHQSCECRKCYCDGDLVIWDNNVLEIVNQTNGEHIFISGISAFPSHRFIPIPPSPVKSQTNCKYISWMPP